MGLFVEAALHQRHDQDLAAVQEPVADTAVHGHGFGGLTPAADPRQRPGAVDEHGDPQLLADLPVILLGSGQGGQIHLVVMDPGCLAPLGGAEQPSEHVVGFLTITFADQEPGDVHHGHEGHHGDVSREAPGVGEHPVLPPT
nr:hypothetical protein GCM10020241_05430 [Streptoalloteichus tenebrarius]